MEKVTHPQLVQALCKPGEDIVSSLTPNEAHLLHMMMGIVGEAGELSEAVKKSTMYRKPLDIANVVEELGDLEFYMEGLRQGLGITREMCLEHNISKLSKRYSSGSFSNSQAQARADKGDAQ